MGTSTTPSRDNFLPESKLGVSPELRLFLDLAASHVNALGPQFSKEYKRLFAIGERLAAETFRLAVLGPCGSGKSTLINALLGESFLPTAMDSLIAAPIVMRYGPEPQVRIWSQEKNSAEKFSRIPIEEFWALLFALFWKEDDFQHHREARRVEVLHPAPILRQGIVLVHVPGISPDSMGDWEGTVDVLTGCDAVLFLVSPGALSPESEANWFKQIRSIDIPVFFILNKVDELSKFEEAAILDILRKAIQGGFISSEHFPAFSVSARRGLDAKLSGDWSLWNASGLQEVEGHLISFLLARKAAAVHEATCKDLVDVLQHTLTQIRLTIQSLEMPPDLLRSQVHDLERELKDIERQRVLAKTALRQDLERTLRELEREARILRRTSGEHLHNVVQEHLSDTESSGNVEQIVQDALAVAVGKFFGDAWEDMARRFRLSVSETLLSHWDQAEGLADHLMKTAAQLFNVPYHTAPSGSGSFKVKRKPYWVLRKWVPAFPRIVPEHWIDRLMPVRLRRKRLTNRLVMQVEALASHNVENLRWALYQNVKNAFDRFALELEEYFLETIIYTRGTIEAACLTRSEHDQNTTDRLERLTSGEAELEGLREEIQSWATKRCFECESITWSGIPLKPENGNLHNASQ